MVTLGSGSGGAPARLSRRRGAAADSPHPPGRYPQAAGAPSSRRGRFLSPKSRKALPLVVGGALVLFSLVALLGAGRRVSKEAAGAGVGAGGGPHRLGEGPPVPGPDGGGGGARGDLPAVQRRIREKLEATRRKALLESDGLGEPGGKKVPAPEKLEWLKKRGMFHPRNRGRKEVDDDDDADAAGGHEHAADAAGLQRRDDDDAGVGGEEEAMAGGGADDNVKGGGAAADDRRATAKVYPKTYDEPVNHNRSPPNPSSDAPLPPLDPPFWHLGDEPDDSVYDRVYMTKDKDGLHALREVPQSMKNAFSPMCSYYRFDEDLLPTVSVIVTSQNERTGLNTLTVHSILARTPPEVLKEIIIVDDNSADPEYREFVDEEEFKQLENLHPKVRVIHNKFQEGCARSRLAGARAASGEVLMFVDSHVEPLSATWYHHLVLPIMENRHTMAVQTIEVMSDEEGKKWGYNQGGGVTYQYGIISEKFLFGYQYKRFVDIDEEKPHGREPYETPFVPGSLFAMRADEFWRLGGYDRGLYVWGGENTELALKTWMCGGRVVMVPCSRVGHVYRVKTVKRGKGQWPPKMDPRLLRNLGADKPGGWMVHRGRADDVTRVVTRNNLRIMNIWVGDHPAKAGYYRKSFGSTELAPEWKQYIDQLDHDEAAQEQIAARERNQCHDFEWFDQQVYKRLLGKHHPWHPSNPQTVDCGAHHANSCRECPQGHGRDWCNGECNWCPELGSAGLCVNSTDIKACPSHKAKTVKKAQRKIDEKQEEDLKKEHHGLKVPEQMAQAPGDRWKKILDKRKAFHARAEGGGAGADTAPHWVDVSKEDNPQGLTLSVVLPCGFEHEYFVRTARSVYLSTPPSVLAEIVIVDDASDPPLEPLFERAFERGDVDNGGPENIHLDEKHLEELRGKVKWVRHDEAKGLIGAKQSGAEKARGDVLVFFDCHIKPDPNYWKAFTRNVGENYKRVVVPTITALNTDTWEEFNRPSSSSGGGGMSKCYLTFDAEFKWTTDSTPHVPIMSGGLLALSRKWFFEVGGYDSEMKGWGGENLDQSLRVWRCGGEIVSAPDSYVAHMWRDDKHRAKYRLHPGDAVLNRARAVKAHVGPWFEKTLTFPSFGRFRDDGGESLDVSSITDGMKDLECESFEWYLDRFKHIYRDAGVVPARVFQLEALVDDGEEGGGEGGDEEPLCLQLEGHFQWNNAAAPNDATKLAPCQDAAEEGSPPTGGTQWWHKSNRDADDNCCSGLRVWNTDQCLNSNGVTTSVCSLRDDNPAYLTKGGKLRVGGLCLSRDDDGGGKGGDGKEKTKLRAVDCEGAVKWRKRGSFEPLEFSLLSEEAKAEWRKGGGGPKKKDATAKVAEE